MDAVARLHDLPGVALLGALLALAIAAGARWLAGREPAPWLDAVRRLLLIVVVVESALGLALALRGAGPDEWIHWVYGVVIVLALLAPASLQIDRPQARSAVLAVGALLGAVMAWRLIGSG